MVYKHEHSPAHEDVSVPRLLQRYNGIVWSEFDPRSDSAVQAHEVDEKLVLRVLLERAGVDMAKLDLSHANMKDAYEALMAVEPDLSHNYHDVGVDFSVDPLYER